MAKDTKAAAAAADATSKAQAIAKKMGVDIIWQNSKGEFFTNENFAALSDKPENITKYDFTAANAAAAAAITDAELAANAKKDVLIKIAAATSKEDAQALIAGYEDDADVKKAIDDKVAALTTK